MRYCNYKKLSFEKVMTQKFLSIKNKLKLYFKKLVQTKLDKEL